MNLERSQKASSERLLHDDGINGYRGAVYIYTGNGRVYTNKDSFLSPTADVSRQRVGSYADSLRQFEFGLATHPISNW